MRANFRRMAARVWPDSLFRRLAIILFAGLLAAHVLSFSLVALGVFGLSNEAGDDYFMRYIATAVAILDRVKPEERPAWLDRWVHGVDDWKGFLDLVGADVLEQIRIKRPLPSDPLDYGAE